MIKAVVTEYEEIVAIVQDGGGAPVPTRGNHYVGALSDVGHSIYMNVETKEKEDIDNGV